MTGKEIAEICASHKLCSECELDKTYPVVCEEVIEDMSDGTPETIYKIMYKDYGGDS